MALDKIRTELIADDAVTAAKIPTGAIGTTEIAEGALSVHALQNTTSHTLSGTYTDSKMYTSDAYVLGGDITVNANLVLSSVKGDDSDITLTDDGTTRTITGTGKLEAGSLLAKERTDLTGMTGELGSTVTGTPAITGLGTVTSGTFNGTLDSTTFSGDAGQKTAKAWINFNGTGTIAIRGSFNVSSITDNGTGRYLITFANGMIDTNYLATISAYHGSHSNNGVHESNYNQLAGSLEFQNGYTSGTGGQATATDVSYLMVGIFGD